METVLLGLCIGLCVWCGYIFMFVAPNQKRTDIMKTEDVKQEDNIEILKLICIDTAAIKGLLQEISKKLDKP